MVTRNRRRIIITVVAFLLILLGLYLFGKENGGEGVFDSILGGLHGIYIILAWTYAIFINPPAGGF